MKLTRIWKIRVNLKVALIFASVISAPLALIWICFSLVLPGWRSTGVVGAEKNARSREIPWVLDFVNLLTVCYNKFVPVASTSSRFFVWSREFPSF